MAHRWMASADPAKGEEPFQDRELSRSLTLNAILEGSHSATRRAVAQ
jgi:hypothetical protein